EAPAGYGEVVPGIPHSQSFQQLRAGQTEIMIAEHVILRRGDAAVKRQDAGEPVLAARRTTRASRSPRSRRGRCKSLNLARTSSSPIPPTWAATTSRSSG